MAYVLFMLIIETNCKSMNNMRIRKVDHKLLAIISFNI